MCTKRFASCEKGCYMFVDDEGASTFPNPSCNAPRYKEGQPPCTAVASTQQLLLSKQLANIFAFKHNRVLIEKYRERKQAHTSNEMMQDVFDGSAYFYSYPNQRTLT
jgi:hypothetical protein